MEYNVKRFWGGMFCIILIKFSSWVNIVFIVPFSPFHGTVDVCGMSQPRLLVMNSTKYIITDSWFIQLSDVNALMYDKPEASNYDKLTIYLNNKIFLPTL